MSAEPSQRQMRGPYQGAGIIGDVTESLHAWLREGWQGDRPAPRIVEDLPFEPKDREEVVYVYMYRVAQNTDLLNAKRWRQSHVAMPEAEGEASGNMLFSRPPLYLDLHYLVAAHARFRSDAERLLGWVLLRLNEATHLVYRPRRYVLPDGTQVDATGRPWSADAQGEGVVMEKVSLAMVDDLSIGDAVHFFNIHEAPYRPYVTYRARCAMEGALIEAPPTVVRSLPVEPVPTTPAPTRPGGRRGGGRAQLPAARRAAPIGPAGTTPRPMSDPDPDSED